MLNLDLSKLQDDVVIENRTDPLNKFKLKFFKTGSYLKPEDMTFCLDRTNFSEEEIIDWFKRFRIGKLNF